ncbi:MAG: MurR/RpiR family transcriptional regulator [Gammaproteobacteria bacterium]|nr:MurR/RpiR family transcriptional regulator [Gammaproteobacteria bacterium]
MPNDPVQPPANLTELKQLTLAINSKSSNLSLGKRSREALTALLNIPEQAAFESINQLGNSINISSSTLSRLATRLGYGGFNELQRVFRENLTEPSSFYSDKATRLELSNTDNKKSACQDILLKVANEEISNIQKMVASVAPGQISDAIQMLYNARSIKVFAQRQFYSLATFFSYCLGLLHDQVDVLGESGHGAPHSLAQMGQQDLLIVFGAYPYSRLTVESCRHAQLQGIPTLVFSDSHTAPLNEGSANTFILPTEGSFYSNSSGAWIVIIESILTAYAQTLGNEAVSKLERRELLFKDMQVVYNQHQ